MLISLALSPCNPALRAANPYGPEKITNGGFDADTDWTKGPGWTISGGVATFVAPGTGQTLVQAVAGGFPTGTTWRIEFDVTAISSGYVYCQLASPGNDSSPLSTITTTGHKVVTLTATAARANFALVGNSTANFSIDNVSVKQVL